MTFWLLVITFLHPPHSSDSLKLLVITFPRCHPEAINTNILEYFMFQWRREWAYFGRSFRKSKQRRGSFWWLFSQWMVHSRSVHGNTPHYRGIYKAREAHCGSNRQLGCALESQTPHLALGKTIFNVQRHMGWGITHLIDLKSAHICHKCLCPWNLSGDHNRSCFLWLFHV